MIVKKREESIVNMGNVNSGNMVERDEEEGLAKR